MDVPNIRSSHSVPTPRGGGVAIVVSFLFSLFVLLYNHKISFSFLLSLTVSGGLIAFIGFWDDFHSVKARWRLLVHFIAAFLGVYLLDGFTDLKMVVFAKDFEWVGYSIGVVVLVWFLNLFNFMDGIDGLAASEAIFIAGGAALINVLVNADQSSLPCVMLAASCLGFLFWNWPPARIFLGDVGSGFLGIVLGLMAINSVGGGQLSLWTWVTLSGVFLVDATITLIRRMITGQRWHEAHRSHAYQILSRRLKSHRKVTIMIMAVNIFWLLPLGWQVTMQPDHGWLYTCIALTPLTLIAVKLKAGKVGD